MPRPRAKTRAKARGKGRVKARKRKLTKKPKARGRRMRRQPKTSPEKLRRELLKLKKSVSGVQKTFAGVPDKEVFLPGGKDWKLWRFLCRKPSPIVIGQPFNGECFIVGRGVTANVFKRGLGGIGLTMDFLIEILEIPSAKPGKRPPRRR